MRAAAEAAREQYQAREAELAQELEARTAVERQILQEAAEKARAAEEERRRYAWDPGRLQDRRNTLSCKWRRNEFKIRCPAPEWNGAGIMLVGTACTAGLDALCFISVVVAPSLCRISVEVLYLHWSVYCV